MGQNGLFGPIKPKLRDFWFGGAETTHFCKTGDYKCIKTISKVKNAFQIQKGSKM